MIELRYRNGANFWQVRLTRPGRWRVRLAVPLLLALALAPGLFAASPAHAAPSRQQRLQAVTDRARRLFPQADVWVWEGIDPDNARRVVDELEQMAKRWPRVVPRFNGVRVLKTDFLRGSAYVSVTAQGDEMQFREDAYRGDRDMAGVVAHEWGHMVLYHTWKHLAPRGDLKVSEFMATVKPLWPAREGRLEDKGERESFAEGVREMRQRPRSRWSAFARKLEGFLVSVGVLPQ